jgi:hypothetical protein
MIYKENMSTEVRVMHDFKVPLPLGIGSRLEGTISKGPVRVRTARIDGRRIANPLVSVKEGSVNIETANGEKRLLKGSEINQAQLVLEDGRSPLRRFFSISGPRRIIAA